MKRINSEMYLNELADDYNLEPSAEEENTITCEICGSDYQIANYRGRDLCTDCAVNIYEV